MARSGVSITVMLVATLACSATRRGMAQTQDNVVTKPAVEQPSRVTPWERFTLDFALNLTYAPDRIQFEEAWSDSQTQQRSAAYFTIRDPGVAQGLIFNAAYSASPAWGLGLDAQLQHNFSAPRHKWLQDLGMEFGPRRGGGVGFFAEYRPFKRDFAPRRGGFLQLGIRAIFYDRQFTQTPREVTKLRQQPFDLFAWSSTGFRVGLDAKWSFHVAGEVGMSPIPSFYAGIRIGGGLH